MKDFATTVAAIFGIHDGVAYVLLNNGILKDRSVNGGNVLTRKTLEVIQADLADAINCDPPVGATGGAQLVATATGETPVVLVNGQDARSPSAALPYEKIIVYGEACRLMAPTLEALKIEFRQTPYDLVTRS